MNKIIVSILTLLLILSCSSSNKTKKIVHLTYDDFKEIRVIPIVINEKGKVDQITTYLDYQIEIILKKLTRFEYVDINNWAMMRDKPNQVIRINKIRKEISRVQALFQNNRMNKVISLSEKLLLHINSDYKFFEDLDEVYLLKAYLAAGEALDDGLENSELFKKIAIMNPNYRFNDNIFGNDVIKLFKRELKNLKRIRKGTLSINSDSTPAKVFIDGKFVGVTPYEGKFKLGIHYIKVEADGYLPYGKIIKVLPQENPVNVVFDSYELARHLNVLRKKMKNNSIDKFPKSIISFLKRAPFDQLFLFKTTTSGSVIYITLYIYDIPTYSLYKKNSFEINLDDKNHKDELYNKLEEILTY